MAKRPVFLPSSEPPYVVVHNLDFTWYPGFSINQKQKSIKDLHRVAIKQELCKSPFEISSKSESKHGVAMSAFNLKVELVNGSVTSLENIFQASKVFERGGPFKDILTLTPLEAKREPRLKEHGDLIGFRSRNTLWPTEPKTLFYDWLYLNVLSRESELSSYCLQFDAFTDIEFNPSKSFNCQARSAALYVALSASGMLKKLLEDENIFREALGGDLIKSLDKGAVQKKLI